MVSIDEYRDWLRAKGLDRYADALVALVRPSVRLLPELIDESAIALGSSKLGGRPDLLSDTRWPEFGDAPMSFIGQVNFAETGPYDYDEVLPRQGLLSFFYDSAEDGVWGSEPADAGGFAVLFTPMAQPLSRRQYSERLPVRARYGVMRLRPGPELTLPHWESFEIEQMGMKWEELQCS